jgi:hypothetical protein
MVITGSPTQHKNNAMKKLAITLFLFTGLLATLPAAETTATPKSQLPKTNTVVWAGLDYSMVHIIGPNLGLAPGSIFPAMPDSWNSLFVWERIVRLGKELDKQVIVDVSGMAERNRLAGTNQVISVGGAGDAIEKSHITPKDIADAVKSYKLKEQSGLGLVYIVDRLVKPSASGALYVVFFNIETREVISADRKTGAAGGAGFRNYWFGVIKDVQSNPNQHPGHPLMPKLKG